MPTFLFVPSPLLGPATWRSTADVLRAAGHRVEVVPVDTVVATARGLDDVVLVPHSNAGYHAAHLADEVGARATVYVDAALPLAPGPDTALATPEFIAFLEGLADGAGTLPPWTQWWEDVTRLFPEGPARAAVEAEQQRVPLSYFVQRVPVPAGWADRPCAYLAFGQTYADEIAFACEHEWPVSDLAGGHLHQLHQPDAVASAILTLVDRLRG